MRLSEPPGLCCTLPLSGGGPVPRPQSMQLLLLADKDVFGARTGAKEV